jgi:serine protease
VGVPDVWQVSRGAGATVAVLDTGVAYEDRGVYHRAPDLAGTKFVPGWDFVDDDSHPDDEPPRDGPSHGTHMAGTIAQTTDNHLGGAGIAPQAAIMPIRVLGPDGSGTPENISKGLRFAADHGANVANLSLGGTLDSPKVAEAVAYATAKGVTVVVSAGDDGQPAVSYPAAYPDAIAVGAVRFDKTRPEYSNYGRALDLVAPGGDLESDQNGDGFEDGIVQQTLYGHPNSYCFCFKQGTSSAAAHVSGIAALIIASGRATRPADVRRLLTETAADLGPPGRDDEYGYGLVQGWRALGLATAPTPDAVGPAASTHDHSHDHGAHDHGVASPGPAPAVTARPVARRESGSSWSPWLVAAAAGGAAVGITVGVLLRRRMAKRRTDAASGAADGRPGVPDASRTP